MRRRPDQRQVAASAEARGREGDAVAERDRLVGRRSNFLTHKDALAEGRSRASGRADQPESRRDVRFEERARYMFCIGPSAG